MKKKAGRKARAVPASATRRARIARHHARRRHGPDEQPPSLPQTGGGESGLPVLVLMPKGRERSSPRNALKRADIRTEICERLDQLDEHISDQTGAVLLAEEAFPARRFRGSWNTCARNRRGPICRCSF